MGAGAFPLRFERHYNSALRLSGWRYTTNNDETECYDAQGRLVALTNRQGLTQTLAYDAAGRLARVTDPAGRTLRFTYDGAEHLQTLTDPAGGVYSYRYDGKGNLASIGYPDATPAEPGGASLRYRYDAAHRLIGLEDALGHRIDYTLDALGNRLGEEVRDPTGVLSRTRSRVYDEMNRLVQEIGGEGQTTLYAYDANGNRISTTDPNGNPTRFAFDALNRRIETADPLEGRTTLTYDARDHATGITDARGLTTTYTYDGLDHRVQETSPDTGTAIAYIHTDPLGTPESLTDRDQALVWQAHRDPFGRTTVTTQAIEHPLRFPGRYFDQETGLHYNYFRDYDPGVGRYVESDPIGLAGGINTYSYVDGNPLTRADREGLISTIILSRPIVLPRPISVPAQPIDPILPIPVPIPDAARPDDSTTPGTGCRFIREVYYGGSCKTCWYECPGYKAPVTFPQAADKSCPGIRPDGFVDTSQIDPKCREQPKACR